MNPERWRHIKAIYQSAMERKPASSNLYFVEACGSDEGLRREVESLLKLNSSPVLIGQRAWQFAWLPPMTLMLRLLVAISSYALVCAAQEQNAQASREIRKAIALVNREIDAAQERRDRARADRRIADPFILIHAGGAFDSRS